MNRSPPTPIGRPSGSIEQKRAPHKPINIQVRVTSQGKLFRSCAVTNVSASGMFLGCTGIPPLAGELVELSFALRYDGTFRHCRLAAEIIQAGDNGFVIGHHPFDASLFRDVHKLMREADAITIPKGTCSVANGRSDRDKCKPGVGQARTNSFAEGGIGYFRVHAGLAPFQGIE